MTTLDQIKKQYNKLTQRERFALMVKAQARGNDIEYRELIRSAPRKHWSMPDTNGLSEGFHFLTMFHVMAMLNNIAVFYFLVMAWDDDQKEIMIEGKAYTIADVYMFQHRNMIGDRDAFRAVCQEYNLDPDELLKDYPYMATIEVGEIFAQLSADDMTEEEKQELEQYTQDAINAYREAIAQHAEGW